MEFWAIEFDNYRGEDEIFYFKNEEIARANFNELLEKNKEKEEFEKYEGTGGAYISWFDPAYNEYSTRVILCQTEINLIESIVF